VETTLESYNRCLDYIQQALSLSNTIDELVPISIFYTHAAAARIYERLGLVNEAFQCADKVMNSSILLIDFDVNPCYPFIGFAVKRALRTYDEYKLADKDISVATNFVDSLEKIYPNFFCSLATVSIHPCIEYSNHLNLFCW